MRELTIEEKLELHEGHELQIVTAIHNTEITLRIAKKAGDEKLVKRAAAELVKNEDMLKELSVIRKELEQQRDTKQ